MTPQMFKVQDDIFINLNAIAMIRNYSVPGEPRMVKEGNFARQEETSDPHSEVTFIGGSPGKIILGSEQRGRLMSVLGLS